MAQLIVVEDLAGVAHRGGQAMYVLQWLEGLRRLGHDVFFAEFLSEQPDPAAVGYFEQVIGRWWSPERAALLVGDESVAGVSADGLRAVAVDADAVIELAAHYGRSPWPIVESVRPRILVEQDPGYTHLWAEDAERPTEIFGAHEYHFTVGSNIGTSRSRIPTVGIDWRPTWNPVILDWWTDTTPDRDDARFATVGTYRDYGYLEYEGEVLGTKAEQYKRFMKLPELAGEPIELALDIDPEDPDLALLKNHGWELVDPAQVSDPDRYRDYIVRSAGEFACAKGGYVGTRSGWFSDRSACYLAAGRPVVLQSTGFEDTLPTGAGLFAVGGPEAAAEAIRAVRADYDRHSSAARALAAEFFDSDRVVARLLTECGLS